MYDFQRTGRLFAALQTLFDLSLISDQNDLRIVFSGSFGSTTDNFARCIVTAHGIYDDFHFSSPVL